MHNLIGTIILLCHSYPSFGQTQEVATVGFPEKIFKYCLETDQNERVIEKKCRTLVLTQDPTLPYYGLYERFEKWEENKNKPLQKTVDSVTYIKHNSAIFDKEFSSSELHLVDLFYPENNRVEVKIGTDGLPDLYNIYLSRSESNEQLSYANVNIDYSEDRVRITGAFLIFRKKQSGEIDTDPIQNIPINEVYNRVRTF